MKLRLPEIMHSLRHKEIFLATTDLPQMIRAKPTDKRRIAVVNKLLPLMHQAEKYIFDSGSDQDDGTVNAVRETAVNMLEAELFHQPYRVMWTEDPFSDKEDCTINFYLSVQDADHISIYLIQFENLTEGGLTPREARRVPNIVVHPYPYVISLTKPDDLFFIPDIRSSSMLFQKAASEAVYAYKKMIVTMNTENMEVERVRVGSTKGHWNGDPRTKPYPYNIVRVPLVANPSPGNGDGSGVATPRRRTLVTGYMWGKHTRPREQQRWIKPFFRGDQTVGIVERGHYEVR